MLFCEHRKARTELDSHQVELLLKFLVGIVDAELFKAVYIKCFKSKNKRNV